MINDTMYDGVYTNEMKKMLFRKLLYIISITIALVLLSCENSFNLPNTSPNGTVVQPVFSPEGGVFNSEQSIIITSETVNAKIFYTLDGSTPDTDSYLYTEAITIGSENTPLVITAKAFLTSMIPSNAVLQSYDVDITSPSIPSGIYGYETDTGWAVIWPEPAGDVVNITYSIIANGETVSIACTPADKYAHILKTQFEDAPSSPGEFTKISLTYYNAAGNSTEQKIEINSNNVNVSHTDKYYIEPQSLNLTNSAGGLVYYTVGANTYPTPDSTLVTQSLSLYGGDLENSLKSFRAACYNSNRMTLRSSVSDIPIWVDSAWDDSLYIDAEDGQITITWDEPFHFLSGDQYINVQLKITNSIDNSPSGATFSPVNSREHIISSGTAYTIDVDAVDINGSLVFDETNEGVYEDVYLREGIIVTAPGLTDVTGLGLSISGDGYPWDYDGTGTSNFFNVLTGTGISNIKRTNDGSLFYYIARQDDGSAAAQLWESDLAGAGAPLNILDDDIIDYTITGTGALLYIAASAFGASDYVIASLTPSPYGLVTEYTIDPAELPSGALPVEIELFDPANIIIRYDNGEISTHSYPGTGAALTSVTTLSETSGTNEFSDVTSLLSYNGGFKFSVEDSAADQTAIFELLDLGPTLDTEHRVIEETGLRFHDISVGGANILFSAVDYRHYSGEDLFVYNLSYDTAIHVMQLSGSYANLYDACW